MAEPNDARLCEFCGYTLSPACGGNIEARGCHLYRKVRYGEGDYTDDASLIAEAEKRNTETRNIKPKKHSAHDVGQIVDGKVVYAADVNHQADAAASEADHAMGRYTGEPTLGPIIKGTLKYDDKEVPFAYPALAEGDAVTLPPHYTRWKIEPIFFIEENAMPFWMGNVIKYVTRAEHKNGIEDLRKARRYLDMRIKKLEGDPEWAK